MKGDFKYIKGEAGSYLRDHHHTRYRWIPPCRDKPHGTASRAGVKKHFAPTCYACYLIDTHCLLCHVCNTEDSHEFSRSGDHPSQGIHFTLYPKAADRRLLNWAQEILVRKALNFRNKDNRGGKLVQDIRSGK